MTKKATFDPSRLVYLYFRIKRAGTKTFTLVDSDGNPFNVGGIYVDYGFELFIKKYPGATDREKAISLTIGDGLAINGNQLIFSVTSDDTWLDEGEYYWELYLNETEKTWLNGKAIFHNGEFDGVNNDTQEVTISENGESITISISDSISFNTRTLTQTSVATLTPNIISYDMFVLTAQAVNLTIANPSGSVPNGNVFWIRVKDNGVTRTLTFGNKYVPFGQALPTATTASTTLYIPVVYNSQSDTYDVFPAVEQFEVP